MVLFDKYSRATLAAPATLIAVVSTAAEELALDPVEASTKTL